MADQENSPFFKKLQARHLMINPQTKQIILNVFFQLSSLNPEKTFRALADETGMLTGVSGRTVTRLKEEETAMLAAIANQDQEEQETAGTATNQDASTSTNCQNSAAISSADGKKSIKRKLVKKKSVVKEKILRKYDENVVASIRSKSESYSSSKQVPSFIEFYKEVNADPQLPNFTRNTLFALMKDMDLPWFHQRYVIPKNQSNPGNKAARMALKKAMRLNSHSK